MKPGTSVRVRLLSTLFVLSVVAGPAFAQLNVNITIGPPAPQYEVVPVVAPGYAWAPGYWARHEDRYVWVRGRPIAQRVGYRWEPDRWEQRGSGYYRHQGNWARDVSYKPHKVKKAKKSKHGDDHDEGRGRGGKHGR